MKDFNSRISNVSNPYQGKYKKVLCVCSAGMLRSPTAALVLSSHPFNFNTRSCGMNRNYALNLLDDVLLAWADEIVCFNDEMEKELKSLTEKPVLNLNVPDTFEYRDEDLMSLIRLRYSAESKKMKEGEERTK